VQEVTIAVEHGWDLSGEAAVSFGRDQTCDLFVEGSGWLWPWELRHLLQEAFEGLCCVRLAAVGTDVELKGKIAGSYHVMSFMLVLWWAMGWMAGLQFLARVRYFSLLHSVQTGSAAQGVE
jgi:hypothetical protein